MATITLFHGSSMQVDKPEIRGARFHKDFGHGFYCTTLFEQAKRWAVRYTGEGFISHFNYNPNESLKILEFTEMTEEWLDFIVHCRQGKSHDYDIVEGPMANDTIFNYIQNFVDGKISRAAFWELARFKKPTHQCSFHTERALQSIQFIKGEVVYDEK